ncbi:MAG TPA: deaminase [Candidatus Saccharimonadales bacterium]|nr:deaminase [Candidatus Saccharimonadales bacterium]
MQRIVEGELESIQPFFEAAAAIAQNAMCQRAKCGAIIVKDGIIIGRGYNGPALDNEINRMCRNVYDLSLKPKYDKTCCIHAEWRAILDACKRNAGNIGGSVLYFMRVDDEGAFTDAGDPFCTTCSRLTLETGVGYFALWNAGGADVYEAEEYNRLSYKFFTPILPGHPS